jgi:signal peptidase I
MAPTIQDRDLLVASKIDYRVHPPERGDIIILKDPADGSRDFIKRIVGLPGDRIQIHNHRVMVNGDRLVEPYVGEWRRTPDWPSPPGSPVIVPGDHYFVLGDNRDNSSDSRAFGWVRRDEIDGRAVIRIWPVEHLQIFSVRPSLAKEP